MMKGHFRITVWDPYLIIYQILAIQSSFYVALGVLLIVGSVLTGTDVTLTNIFNYRAINFVDKGGILTVSSYAVNALIGSCWLWLFVKRTKQCLDFTATCYLFHLLICWVYNGYLPNVASWWILTAASITVMCVCGEFLCLRTELQDIPLIGAKVDI